MCPYDFSDNKRTIPSEIMIRDDEDIWREYQINDTFIDLVYRINQEFSEEDSHGTAYLIEGIYGSGRTALLYAIEKMMTSHNIDNSKNSSAFHEKQVEICLEQLREKQIGFIHSIHSPEGLLDSIQKANARHRCILVCDDVTEMILKNAEWLTSFVREAKTKNLTLIFTSFLIKQLPVFCDPYVEKLIRSFNEIYRVETPQELPSKHYIQTYVQKNCVKL